MNLHTHTPSLTTVDPRGLAVGQVGFYRADLQPPADVRRTRQVFDMARRIVASIDPRLDRPSTTTVFSLSGQTLLSENVDAGWRLALLGEAGQALCAWDSRGTYFLTERDELMRPLAISEMLDGEPIRVVERYVYGDASESSALHNQCGVLIRRDDTAGLIAFSDYGLAGGVLLQQRRFLLELVAPDWPEALVQRDSLLEAEGYSSTTQVNASGEVIEQHDARGNRQLLSYTCAGQLAVVQLQQADSDQSQTLVSDIRYNPWGAVEHELAGNGVVSQSKYDPASGRLIRLLAKLPSGDSLQDLNHLYDPVGNILSIEDASQASSFFRNQRVDPVSRYTYDSLYQLIEATGCEVAPVAHLPGLPDLQPLPMDPAKLINYTQRFEYDAGGNLLARHHSGADTWRMAVSSNSNRSLPQRADGSLPDDAAINTAFDGNGNLKALQPGQAMTWDGRNQLSEITAVKREDGSDDSEVYRYDGDGQRVRKVRMSQTRARTLAEEVRYLPGLALHRNEATGEVWQVLTIDGSSHVIRVLHWDEGIPEDVENDQLRYCLTDHLGSSTVELDRNAKLISQEGYYPFGGTAWWAARSVVEAKYKTVRYSGKERDATGLYYYGYRYYVPWLQRWVNPDPAGDIQNFNRYGFVINSPVGKVERDGQIYEGVNDRVEEMLKSLGDVIVWRGLSELQALDSEQAQRIRIFFANNDEVFRGAIAAAQDPGWDNSAIGHRYFGYYANEAIPFVVKDWVRTQALISNYRSPEGYDKIVGVIPDRSAELASVVSGDSHGRIFLNNARLKDPALQKTIAHEFTHLGRVSGFKDHAGPKTVDNFYLDERFAVYLPMEGSNIDVASVSDHVVNGNLTQHYVEQTWTSKPHFVSQVNLLYHQPESVSDLATAVRIFNTSPHISSVMASRNADSIVEAAYGFYEAHKRFLRAQRRSIPPH